MSRTVKVGTLAIIFVLLYVVTNASTEKQSVLEVMTLEVTPATNALWGADNPQSDAQWQTLDDAADDVIKAFKLTKIGGGKTKDKTWAANEDWQRFSDEIIAAATLAKKAIANRDMDALMTAGDALYTPCEACHLVYHPGVAEP